MSSVRNDVNKIEETMAVNLRNLLKDMEWSQSKLASVMGVGEASASAYVNGKQIPAVMSLVNLCDWPDIKKKYGLTIDQLLFEMLDFAKTSIPITMRDLPKETHADYIGNYFLYFYDQAAPDVVGGIRESRRLRYGVISIYAHMRRIGDEGIFCHAKFFKTFDAAKYFRNELNAIATEEKVESREKVIEQYRQDKEYYTGELYFTDNHTFIDLFSSYYGDKALVALYATQKKADKHYIGGIGTVVSISHGALHMPVAQKIIISSSEIKLSDEEIGRHLRIAPESIHVSTEAEDLLRLYHRLYGTGQDMPMSFLGEHDKNAIFNSRVSQLIKNSIDKELNSICAVSEQDDAAIYKMIKNSEMVTYKERI